jgi:hypothetical protein
MNTVKQFEQIRKKMEAISERVNSDLGEPEKPRPYSGIQFSDDNKCPACDSPLRTKYGIIKGLQRWRCVECGKQFYGEE